MIKVYLAHPFNYPGDPKQNREEAREIAWKLTTKYGVTVFNPLDNFQCLEGNQSPFYIMTRCIDMLKQADVVFLTGKWAESAGCRTEYFVARELPSIIVLQECEENRLQELTLSAMNVKIDRKGTDL